MKQRAISGAAVLVVLTGLGFQVLSRQDPAPSPETSSEKAAEERIQTHENAVTKTLEQLKKVESPSLEKVAEELKTSGDAEALASYEAYEKQQKTYDAAFRRYEAVHRAYRASVHAAPDANSPEVEGTLAQVDAEIQNLQAETEALNARAADFLEEYRRHTFDKFGLALN